MIKKQEDDIRSLINRRRRQILVHSIIYYKYNENLVSDAQWADWGIELEQLQRDYPTIASECVYVDITAPLYWWKEFDTYKVGTVANSCSTMHKIAAKEFTLDDFSHEHLLDFDEAFGHGLTAEYCEDCGTRVSPYGVLGDTIKLLNLCREKYLAALKTEEETGLPAKDIWWQMIQLLPSSYNQRHTVMLNYEVLANIYPMRKNHKLDEWHTFCDWIKTLPYSELITSEKDEPAENDIFDENVTFGGVLTDFEKHHRFLGSYVVDYPPITTSTTKTFTCLG